ncbi:MAG TPA: ABC transporter substrate-binding protein [Candidatus Angelobacter sp.]|nr:ABC transporter substrate-binding protein [Candidatus Angelobacter sp.]
MWKGAEVAYIHSPVWTDLREIVALRGCDDEGVSVGSEMAASQIRLNPETIAVIGHATSGTTRSAAAIYASANIPVLMPIATSPNVFFDPSSGDRLQNLFRLPPSDDRAQAPAVAYTAINILKSRRIYLVRDISEDAPEYSGPLFKRIQQLIGSNKIDDIEVNRKTPSIHEVAQNVFDQDADLVIFVGYGTTANVILSDIQVEYSRFKRKPPPILLTDGCKIVDLNVGSLLVYVTFPVPDSHKLPCDTEDMAIFNEQVPQPKSYELYGYDAMVILGKALNSCLRTSSLSRECVQNALSGGSPLEGACLTYSFSAGDNSRSSIYLYRARASGPDSADYEQIRVVTPDDWHLLKGQ